MTDARDQSTWRERVRHGLRGRPAPLFVFENAAIPAASVWTGSRLWVEHLRRAGLSAGDRLVLALPPSPAWLMVFAACLWEGITVVPVDARSADDLGRAADLFDARLAVATDQTAGDRPHASVPDRHGRPPLGAGARPGRLPPSAEICLIMSTSGTSGRARHVALSDRNVQAVIDSHAAELGLDEDSVCLSLLPWTHAFGLIIDLLTAVFAGATVVRDPAAGRHADAASALGLARGVTHCCMVPLHAEKFAGSDAGRAFLASLRGGVVGGAPVDASLAGALAPTRLRVGYGQTEASPGITLGAPGLWHARTIGRPVGCEVRIDERSHLLCRGPNVCAGVWDERLGVVRGDAGRWLDTGDLVSQDQTGCLTFLGRADQAFKLINGRLVNAPMLESRLASALGGGVEVVLTTADHRTIDVHVITGDDATPASLAPRTPRVARAAELVLGSLMGHLGRWTVVDRCDAARDAKGQINRALLGTAAPANRLAHAA